MLKKLLLVLCTLAFMGTAQAQSNTHWPNIQHQSNGDPLNMMAIVTINIEGVEIANPNLEMVAFIGETQMSNGQMPNEVNGRYVYYMTLCGFNDPYANSSYTFKLYDHNQETELDWVSPFDIVSNK